MLLFYIQLQISLVYVPGGRVSPDELLQIFIEGAATGGPGQLGSKGDAGTAVSGVVGATGDAFDVEIFGFAYGFIRRCDDPNHQLLLGHGLVAHVSVLNRNWKEEDRIIKGVCGD